MVKEINDFAFKRAEQKLDILTDFYPTLCDQMTRHIDTPYWQVDLCRSVYDLLCIADDLHSQLAVCIDRIDELSVLVEVLDNKYSDLLYHLSNKDE